jgi:hypothetical protein
MNVWALQKDNSIKHLLLMLENDLPGWTAWVVSEPDSVDDKAIRLCDSKATSTCVYIYTYGQKQERYGLHLEYPVATDVNYSDTVDMYEDISYSLLLTLLEQHLNA